MARAGFYAVESGKISFRRDGHWYSDDERIGNSRIALLFSRSIHRAPDGGYFLQVGDEREPITVEDTPYVVKSIEGDAQTGFTMVLNDDTREPLDPGFARDRARQRALLPSEARRVSCAISASRLLPSERLFAAPTSAAVFR